eukprot:TRINITY_DN8318_c0_g1_i1.p1 TRINITY_DN8318_c0_g1~~TRINITY_DN8318_c0_g1_i1.p1  ORF type:complete len:225 (+),score=37.49 TRINITY_DN8318_c0_g1_i1:56-676(+)
MRQNRAPPPEWALVVQDISKAMLRECKHQPATTAALLSAAAAHCERMQQRQTTNPQRQLTLDQVKRFCHDLSRPETEAVPIAQLEMYCLGLGLRREVIRQLVALATFGQPETASVAVTSFIAFAATLVPPSRGLADVLDTLLHALGQSKKEFAKALEALARVDLVNAPVLSALASHVSALDDATSLSLEVLERVPGIREFRNSGSS